MHFPYEVAAKDQMPMPDGLSFPDQLMYQTLRLLYKQYMSQYISKLDAQRERLKMIDQYRVMVFREDAGARWVELIKKTEIARSAYRKNPTIENANALVEAIDGVPIKLEKENDE